jgi:hypothetical protein
MSMWKLRNGSLSTVALLAMALLAAASPATATPTAELAADPWVWEITRPGMVNAPPEDCRERTAPNSGRAYVCYAYGRDDGNLAYGYYRATLSAGTYLRIYRNGGVHFTTTWPDARGLFWDTTAIYFQACNASGCGAAS